MLGAVVGAAVLLFAASSSFFASGYTVAGSILALMSAGTIVGGITWSSHRNTQLADLRGSLADLRGEVADLTRQRDEARDALTECRHAAQDAHTDQQRALANVRNENRVLAAKLTNTAAIDNLIQVTSTLLAKVKDIESRTNDPAA